MAARQPFERPEAADRLIARIASTQYGLFTLDQAAEAGATAGLVKQRLLDGRWSRPYRRVYQLAGMPRSWHQDLVAACLAGGPGAAASYRSAGRLWSPQALPTELIEISVQRTRHTAARGIIVHRPRDLTQADLTVVEAIPVTTPPRTLIDLAGVLLKDVLEELLDDYFRRHLLTIRWLRWRIDELKRPGKPGIGVIEALCAAREDDQGLSESVLEDKLFRVLKNGGLPNPVRQHPVRVGGLDYRLDFAYPDAMIGIEADGYASRASRRRWEQELARQNALVGAGWHLVRFTWTTVVERPDLIVRTVARALATRSTRR
jgi:very-short-patch-repair endonuclease